MLECVRTGMLRLQIMHNVKVLMKQIIYRCDVLIMALLEQEWDNASLVPRPPPFFVFRYAFSIIHGSGGVRKTGKAWSHPSREWTRGEEPIFKYVTNTLQK